jgi:3-hydroxybutyryl-CoA dehydratase
MPIGRKIEEFEVGMQCEFSHTFTAEETQQMGDLIGDHNPFHYEGEFIQNTRFQRPIVHGFLIGGMICHFGGDIFPGPGYLAEKIEMNFIKPVYFGETIRAVGTVTEIELSRRRVYFAMECFNEQNEVVLTATSVGIPYYID